MPANDKPERFESPPANFDLRLALACLAPLVRPFVDRHLHVSDPLCAQRECGHVPYLGDDVGHGDCCAELGEALEWPIPRQGAAGALQMVRAVLHYGVSKGIRVHCE